MQWRKWGSIPLWFTMNLKAQTILPPGTVITKCPDGRAKGLREPMMRARGERGTESRLPKKRPARSKRPYEHIPKDLAEPGIKTPVGYIKPVGIPWTK